MTDCQPRLADTRASTGNLGTGKTGNNEGGQENE